GESLISAGEDGVVRVWDSEGRELHRFGKWRATPPPERANTGPPIALSADGKLLAVAYGNEPIHLHDPATGKEVGTIRSNLDSVAALASSPDNKVLAAGADDHAMALYDV